MIKKAEITSSNIKPQEMKELAKKERKDLIFTKQKKQKACTNLNDVVSELRVREVEVTSKDEELRSIACQLKSSKVRMRTL